MQDVVEGPIEKKDILVVDDDDVVREKIRRILNKNQYEVHEACSGKEATSSIKNTEYDCILLDHRLGDGLGLDLVPEILSLIKRPCPIIMITGNSDERVIVEAMRSGIYDYINKQNINKEHLSATISAGLNWAILKQELEESQQKLQYLSLYDELTSLPNRHLFFDRLEQSRLLSIRENDGFAVLMMDLNLFKEVNDTFGHSYGDEVLKQVGVKLQNVARDTDTFARLGGDEFAAILPHVANKKDALLVINKITKIINTPIIIDDQPISIGISIGVSFYSNKEQTINALLADADAAMYKAKLSGSGHFFYDSKECAQEASNENANGLMKISGHLSDALDNNEFSMVYQPIISLDDGSCHGIEALARWDSPILGNVLPVDFIGAAERSPLILTISYHLIELAVKQLSEWSAQGITTTMAVNLSAKVFDSEGVVENIAAILEKHAVAPTLLTIEITETALLNNPTNAIAIINQLSDIGIKISIDDFGTGYTSFKYLRQFLFSELKVDKLFVTQLEEDTRDASIVQSFISLSKGFDVTLIAEGIEDAERLLLLKAMGCGRAQGYFISRPLSGDKFPSWLDKWHKKASSIFDNNV